jgi:hypothetical protein
LGWINSDSIPVSIPTRSPYIGSDAKVHRRAPPFRYVENPKCRSKSHPDSYSMPRHRIANAFKRLRREDPVHWTKPNSSEASGRLRRCQTWWRCSAIPTRSPAECRGPSSLLTRRPKTRNMRLPQIPTWWSPILPGTATAQGPSTGRSYRARSEALRRSWDPGWCPIQFQRVSLDAAGAGVVSEFSEQAPEFFRIAV